MKFIIEYEICLDEDYPNPANFTTIEADSKKEAIAKFYKMDITKAVAIDAYEDGESK